MEKLTFPKKTVSWYKNIGPSDARFFKNEAMWKEGSRTAALKQIEVPSFVAANWKGQICLRGRALSCLFFLSSLHVYQLIQHGSQWTSSCGVLGGMTRTYLYHFVLFQLSIHTKLGVDSSFWLWKPWISNFACFPFRLPCVWCRSQKTCWHCRSEPEISEI